MEHMDKVLWNLTFHDFSSNSACRDSLCCGFKWSSSVSHRFIMLTIPGLVFLHSFFSFWWGAKRMDHYHPISLDSVRDSAAVRSPEAPAHSNTARMSHSMVFGLPTMKHPPSEVTTNELWQFPKNRRVWGPGNGTCSTSILDLCLGTSDQPKILTE